jgi:hypothetical protein
MFVPTLGVGIKSPGVYAAQFEPLFVLYSNTSVTVPVPPLPGLNVALIVWFKHTVLPDDTLGTMVGETGWAATVTVHVPVDTVGVVLQVPSLAYLL